MDFQMRINRSNDRHFVSKFLPIALSSLAALPVIAQEPLENATPTSSRKDDEEFVGRSIDESIVTPVNQRLTPVGKWLQLPGMRPQVIAISPDGRIGVTSGKTSKLVVFDPEQATIMQQVELPSEEQRSPAANPAANNLQPDTKAIASFTGLLFSPDGKSIYLSNVQGSIKVFRVGDDGKVVPSHAIALPDADAPMRKQEIPSGLAFNADATKLYVCGNLSNKLLEIQLDSGIVTRTWDVGVAPYDVRIVGNTAIVSNWGGRRPAQGDLVGPAGKGTTVRVDPVRFIANEGSVSFVDLESSRIDEVIVGLHPSGLCVSRNEKYAICANAGSDTLSVLDIAKREEIEKIWTKTNPSELFGASPNALTFGADDDELFVANETNNAIAVIEFEPEQQTPRIDSCRVVSWGTRI